MLEQDLEGKKDVICRYAGVGGSGCSTQSYSLINLELWVLCRRDEISASAVPYNAR